LTLSHLATQGSAQSVTPELRLLLACARVDISLAEEDRIRQILAGEVDWTRFAKKAMDHGLACLVGHTLLRVSNKGQVPDDILAALRSIIDRSRRANSARFEEFAVILDALAARGVRAIPFKGPTLALAAYGDIGLRSFRDLDFLVRDPDLPATIATLREFGYVRDERLSEAQLDLIHRLQGQDTILSQDDRLPVEPHTRLSSAKMALDIDYAGIWNRARPATFGGRTLLTLAPEDELIALAIHGGKEMWWSAKWACDVALFVRSRPTLDWDMVAERARGQGCLRMVLLATLLARSFFDSAAPDMIARAERSEPILVRMMQRVLASWLADEALGPPSNSALSLARLWLHDGLLRRARYVARTLLLPGPHHVGAVPLPKSLQFAYGPVAIAHDVVALPVWRAYRQVQAQIAWWQNALARSEFALALIPASAERKLSLRRRYRARADAERAVAEDPKAPAAWRNLGDALAELTRHREAITCYDKALALAPSNTAIWKRRQALVQAMGSAAEFVDAEPDLQDAQGWAVRAARLFSTGCFTDASQASERALAIDPENNTAARVAIQSRLFKCDWQRRAEDEQRIADSIEAGRPVIEPFFHRALRDSEAEHFVRARLAARPLPPSPPSWEGGRYRHEKIRLAYVSTDLRHHVVAEAIVGCFEHHDRGRFLTHAVSLGPDDGSPMRQRIKHAFDHFIDGQAKSDVEIALMLRQLEIDVVVDLNGNSGERRPGILARRPVPVQAHFLGYPGTMGVRYMDYMIADQVVIPEANLVHYSENVIYLPHSYMPTDRTRPIAPNTPTRAEAGLPETGFVFVCHNHEYKITPEVFDVWMRLLLTIEGSVLWLKFLNPAAMSNLWREAEARGVASERLVFAPRMAVSADHLARLRLGDLFLDTRPYNAHATAADALWAGLPVLTCPGNTFAARVAASLLHAIGLPELVTGSLEQYEAMAVALARNPDRLAVIRAKLAANRDRAALFDTTGHTRHLEAAYQIAWERHQKGLPPAAFSVGAR
jgi:protein O-GlcNAc transferase